MLLRTAALLLLAGTTAVHALNWKTGIDLTLSGTEGTDYVIEQLYYDSLYDDRSVIWMKSSVQISMESNDRNIMNKRNPEEIGVATDSGWIYYKIDGDGLREGYPYGLGAAGPWSTVSPPIHLYDTDGPVSFTSVKGQTGENADPHYYHGVLDAFGDEWHNLTYWHDVGGDVGWGSESNSDDGKIIQLILDPQTPAIKLTCTAPGAEYYTTPPRQYYLPHVFSQTSYVTAGVTVTLTNLQGTDPVHYKVDDGAWQTYTAPLATATLFGTDNTAYTLSYRNGTDGTIRTRTFHYTPASPTAAETHPSGMCWRSPAERQELVNRFATEPYLSRMNDLKSLSTLSGHTDKHHTGLRYGKREYYYTAPNLLRIAFVAQMQGYDYESGEFARVAKEMLINMYCIDPISFETASIAGGRKAPCLERCAYPGDHKTPDIPLAYDLMASFTTANGHADGFTPIEELKVRDNLASEANLRLKWFGIGYGDFWHNYLENAMAAFAIALPTYDTPYYGTSGADGRSATHPWTPFPDTRITWWEYVNGGGDVTGYPNLGAKSTYHTLYDGPFGLGIYGEDGYWYCDDFNGYQSLTESGAITSLAVRARYDGVIPERFASRLDFHIRTRHPYTGKCTGENACSAFYKTGIQPLINASVPDAGLYRWHQGFPDVTGVAYVRNVYDMLYFDNGIAPEPPQVQSKEYQSVLAFGAHTDTRDGIMLRMLNKYENTDASNYRIPLTTHFTLDAYGSMLAVDGINGRDDNDGKTAEARNVVLVDDDASTLNSGPSKMLMGRIGATLFADNFDYGCVSTRRDLRGSDGSPFYNDAIDQTRHVLFPDKKYFIIIDEMTSGTGSHTYGWTLHGSSDGSTDPARFAVDNTANTVTWVKNDGVSLKAAFVAPDVNIDGTNTKSTYFTGKSEPYAIASATGTDVRFVTALLPLDNGQAAPTIADISVSSGTAFSMDDGSGAVYCHTQDETGTVTVSTVYSSDGAISLAKDDGSGGIVYGSVINGTHLTAGGTTRISADARTNLYYEKPASGDTMVRFMVKPDTSGVEMPITVTLGGLTADAAYGVLRDGQSDTNVTADGSGNAVISVLALNDEFGQEPREYTLTTGTVGITRNSIPAHSMPAYTNPLRIGTGFTIPDGTVLYDHSGTKQIKATEPGVYYLQYGDAVRKLILVK